MNCEWHHWIVSVPPCSNAHLTVGIHNVVIFPQSNTCLSVARTDFGLNTCFVVHPQCPSSYSQGHVLQANSQVCITISLSFNEQENTQRLYSAACSEWAVTVPKVRKTCAVIAVLLLCLMLSAVPCVRLNWGVQQFRGWSCVCQQTVVLSLVGVWHSS